MVTDAAGRWINGNIDKLCEHFEYTSEFPDILSDRTDLSETAEEIIRMIPYLTSSQAGRVIRTMLIISHGTAAGPKKKYQARRILDLVRNLHPDEYERVKKLHGY